ncbi:MAG: endolytic transglycosylase MltG [Coriobacteriales bacterium]|nr:endolytic transglycosylase MltG [Coriobacteriales bacterium]
MPEYRGKHSSPSGPDFGRFDLLGGQPTTRSSSHQSAGGGSNAKAGGHQPFFVKRSAAAHRRAARQFPSYDTSAIRPQQNKLTIALTIALVVLVLGGLVFGSITLYGMFSPEREIAPGHTVTVTIESGTGAIEIARQLKEAGVITDEQAFRQALVDHNAAEKLQPGSYTLKTGMDLDELISLLVTGPVVFPEGNKLTIPEGLTAEATAARVQDACGIAAADFLACVYDASRYLADYPFLEGVYNNSLEGFLYPKTYMVPFNASADDVVRILLTQFAIETANLDMNYALDKNLSLFDVVTIASLIENETANPDERPLVASVVYNRLRADMRLQIDATVIYALGAAFTGPPVTYKDLEVDSPYNTYQVSGLPAGPICSPRFESIEAAAHPTETDYLFYVVTSDAGTHSFFATEAEFDVARESYLGAQ